MNVSDLELTDDDRENGFVLHYCPSHGGKVIASPNATVTCVCGRTCLSTAQLGPHKGGRAPLNPLPAQLIGDRMVEPKI